MLINIQPFFIQGGRRHIVICSKLFNFSSICFCNMLICNNASGLFPGTFNMLIYVQPGGQFLEKKNLLLMLSRSKTIVIGLLHKYYLK